MSPTKRRSPEKAVQRRVIHALQSLGWWTMDMSQPRPSMMPRGLPDLYALHVRHPALWIEVKAKKRGRRPEDLLSLQQRAWHSAAQGRGQNVITVDGVDCLLERMREIGVLEAA